MIEHVGWVGHDEVEIATDPGKQVTVRNGHIAHPRQRSIDRGIAQCQRVDVHGADLGMLRRAGDQQGTDAAAATNVHSVFDPYRAAL
ncbi:hypothetical protein D3C79_797450 [compost metagenome]